MELRTTHVLLFLLYIVNLTTAYDGATCCTLAKSEKAFVGEVPPFANQTCGQEYQKGLLPAAPLYITYQYCKENCDGIDLTRWVETDKWTAPLVQFILPSIIFSMTVPRQKKIAFENLFDYERLPGWLRLIVSMVFFALILIPVLIDTVVWISTVVVCAGTMLMGGMFEAHIDYRLIRYLQSLDDSQLEENLSIKRELLVTIAAGNLELGPGSPQRRIPAAITRSESADGSIDHAKACSRLLNLLGSQMSFGTAVGSPVLFYLGAFAYSILDLLNNPSSQPASIALGFGIEWMIIVHVAIVSGCLLASNNPSTSSGIVGSPHTSLRDESRGTQNRTATLELIRSNSFRPSALQTVVGVFNKQNFARLVRWLGWSPAFETKFQPVSLRARGTNKMSWVRKSKAWRDQTHAANLKKEMNITNYGWALKFWFPCVILIAIPPATGGIVAYYTPPKGVGCRSLSFILYAACQFVLVTAATIHSAAVENLKNHIDSINLAPNPTEVVSVENKLFVFKVWRWLVKWLGRILTFFFTGKLYALIISFFYLGALLSAVGGNVMQLMGVWNNCLCYAGSESWYNAWKANAHVNLADDTDLARKASVYWIRMGGVAAGFMALNAYVGWWYQRLVRKRFEDVVVRMRGNDDQLNAHQDEDSDDNGGHGPPPRPGANGSRNSLDALSLRNYGDRFSTETFAHVSGGGGRGEERGRTSTDGLLREDQSQHGTGAQSEDDDGDLGRRGSGGERAGRGSEGYGRASGSQVRGQRVLFTGGAGGGSGGGRDSSTSGEGIEMGSLQQRTSFGRQGSQGNNQN